MSFGPPISRTAAGLASGKGFAKVQEECGDCVNSGQCESAFPQTLGNWGVFIGEGSARTRTESHH
jgi:hypothetical protein